MSSSGLRSQVLHILAGALILILAIQLFSESSLKSPASDEPPHIASGLSYVSTGNFRGNPQHPPLLKELSGLSLLLGGIRWPRNNDTARLLYGERLQNQHPEWQIGNSIIASGGPDRVLFWARLPFILLACALGFLIYLWGSQMLGAPAGLGALFLYTLDPIILGHGFLVTMDVGLATFTVLFLFTLWHYLTKPGWTRFVLCGLVLGALLSAKFSGLFLLPAAALLLAFAILRPLVRAGGPQHALLDPFHIAPPQPVAPKKKAIPAPATLTTGRRLLLGAGILLGICLLSFVVIQALYFFPASPLTYFDGLKLVNADHDADFEVFLAGEFQRRFTSYFAVAYLLKAPLAGIVLAAVGLTLLLASSTIPLLTRLFLLLPPLAIFLGHTIWADNLGVRYMIPALPFAHLLGGLALATLFARRQKWVRGLAAVLCGWAVLAAAGVYPDHLSYFNETACLLRDPGKLGIAGGTACGPDWLNDSNVDWGQGLKQLKVWMETNAAGRAVKVANPFGFPADAYGIKTEPLNLEELVRHPNPGLYAISAHIMASLPPGATEDNWPQSTAPVAIVGHALYIYDIRPLR